MILRSFWHARLISLVGLAVALLLPTQTINADTSKYPQFAQQTLPENITPTFIGIEQLVADLKAGVKPVLIDVRTAEEYREAHILGAVSAPLEEFKDYLKSIPRDRPVVLY
jgi:hypothetical protein